MWIQAGIIFAISCAVTWACLFYVAYMKKQSVKQIVAEAALLYGVSLDEANDAIDDDPLRFAEAMLKRFSRELWQNRLADGVAVLWTPFAAVAVLSGWAIYALPVAYWFDAMTADTALLFGWLMATYRVAYLAVSALVDYLVLAITGRYVGHPAKARKLLLKERDAEIARVREREAQSDDMEAFSY